MIVLAGFLVLPWIGCTRSAEDIVTPEVMLSNVTISVSVPATRTPSTRGMISSGQEEKVRTVDLLVFDATDPNNETFLQWVEADPARISQDDSKVTFTARLKPTTVKTRILVIANHSLENMVSSYVAGVTTRITVMCDMIHDNTGKWNADETNYTAIPMYGEKLLTSGISTQMAPIGGIDLTRMLARIDIKNNAANFTVEEVRLVNYNTIGYVAPPFNGQTGLLDPAGTTSIPGNPGKVPSGDEGLSYLVNLANGDSYAGEIYTYESVAAVDVNGDNDATSRKDAVCLVVKGKLGTGNSYYYRVDFTQEGNTSYMPLKRNYHYIVDIVSASGDAVGYTSISDAIRSYTVVSNLKTRVIAYNTTVIKDLVFNGQYMLGLQESDVTFEKNPTERVLKVFTDNPSGWNATIPSAATWLSFGDGTKTTSGAANSENDMELKVSSFAGTGSRTANVTVTAGRLTNTIRVTQTDQGMTPSIKIVDEYGNPITNLFFPSNKGTSTPVPPQTIYVVWTGGTCKGFLSSTGEIIYSSIQPQLYRGESPTPPVTFDGNGVQAIVIQPQRELITDKYWRWDWMYFRLYDKNGIQIGNADLKLDQANMLFNAKNLNANGYPLGAKYTIAIESNALWTIDNITESSEGLLGSGGDFYIGKTGGTTGSTITDNLDLNTAAWAKDKSGIITVSFEVNYAGYIFNRTIEIRINAPYMDYTHGVDNSKPRFYMYPVALDVNMDLTTATGKCTALGTGWRIPTISELGLAYAYREAFFYENPAAWNWQAHWSSSTTTKNILIQGDGQVVLKDPSVTSSATRCVRVDATATGTEYPYITTHADGAVIVSRDTNGGVGDAVFFSSSDVPNATAAMNKMAPKLLVAKADQSVTDKTWAGAMAGCPSGWRLPTIREAHLILSLGGLSTTTAITDPGFNDITWPSGYAKMQGQTYWLLTENATDTTKAWVFDSKAPTIYTTTKTVTWPRVRCVKSLW